MAENTLPNLSQSSAEETDSADESFTFTRKRKANSFFIDLTDEGKKMKTEVEVPNLRDNESATANGEVHIVKVVPGDGCMGNSGNGDEVPTGCQEKASSAAEFSLIKVPLPKLFSPPCVVGAEYKCGEVIDLTQSSAAAKKWPKTEKSDDASAVSTVCEVTASAGGDNSTLGCSASGEVYQNQLMDPRVEEEHNQNLWLGKNQTKPQVNIATNDYSD